MRPRAVVPARAIRRPTRQPSRVRSAGALATSCLAGFALAGYPASRDAGPVVITAAGPWHRPFSVMQRRGTELAAAEVNAAAAAGRGRAIELRFANDSADGGSAARVACELVQDGRVVAVVGHGTSSAMVAAAPVYDAGRLPAVSTMASSPALTGASPWVFRMVPSDTTTGAALARYAAGRGWRRAVALYEADPYGRGLLRAFRDAYPGRLVDAVPIDPDSTRDPALYVRYLANLRPDVVFVASTDDPAVPVLREARRIGLATQFLGADGWIRLAAADPAASEGVLVGLPFFTDAAASAADDAGAERAAARRFVTAFQTRYGVAPSAAAAAAYDAVWLAATAAARSDGSRAGVRGYLAALDARRPFRGATGPVYFAHGDAAGRRVVVTRAHAGVLHRE
jgi:branched-chain amino acid transport system substrate-binding protein